MATLKLNSGALITTSNESIIRQYLAQGAVEYKPTIDVDIKEDSTVNAEDTTIKRKTRNKNKNV